LSSGHRGCFNLSDISGRRAINPLPGILSSGLNLCSKIFPFAILYVNPEVFPFFLLYLSFSLSFLGLSLVLTHCRCRGLLLHLITLSNTQENSSGRDVDLRRDLCLTTHNIHKRQTSTPSAEFEKAIPASEWPQACTLDRVITGIRGDLFSTTQNVFLPIAAHGSLNIFKHVKTYCNMDRRNLRECLEKKIPHVSHIFN